MARTTRRLGRGLDALVSDLRKGETADVRSDAAPGIPAPAAMADAKRTAGTATMLPIDALHPNPYQPRKMFNEEEIDALSRSIERNGVLQPIIVRYHEGSYQIIAGERRWRAAKRIGMTSVPVIIRNAQDEQMVELALIENLQREDLNPIDRAGAYRAFCDRFGFTAEQVAERVGEDRSTVTNYMRLLDLPPAVRELVAAGQLGMGHARTLLGVSDAARQLQLAESAARHELSVRALEDIVRRERKRPAQPDEPPARTPPRSAHLKELQGRFERALQTKVTIHEGKKKGTGRLVIHYFSLDDFDRLAETMGVAFE